MTARMEEVVGLCSGKASIVEKLRNITAKAKPEKLAQLESKPEVLLAEVSKASSKLQASARNLEPMQQMDYNSSLTKFQDEIANVENLLDKISVVFEAVSFIVRKDTQNAKKDDNTFRPQVAST